MATPAKRAQPQKGWRLGLWVAGLILIVVGIYFYYPVLVEESHRIDDAFRYWLPRLIVVGLILLIAVIIVSSLNKVTEKMAHDERRYALFKTAGYVILIAATVIAVTVLVPDLGAFAISAGLIGFGITLALQKPILCFVGWIWITTRRLYLIGDRVRVGDVRGDVVDVSIITTTLWEFGSEWIKADQPSGRMISIPNSSVLEQPVYNYTRDFPYVWDEVTINVAQEGDWKFAITLLEKVADEIIGNERMAQLIGQYEAELSKTPLRTKLSRKPAIHAVVGESWIDLTVRYLVDVRQMRRTKTMFFERIMEEFSKHPDKLPPSYRRVQSQQIDETGRPIVRSEIEVPQSFPEEKEDEKD